jgi:hypothetical protein
MTLGGGGADVYVKTSEELAALVPAGVLTVTSTVPAPAGEVAVICELLSTLKRLAGAWPKRTSVAPAKSLPVTVTLVPPAAGPEPGWIPLIAGADTLTVNAWRVMRFASPPVKRLSSQICAAPPAARSGTWIAVMNDPLGSVWIPEVRVIVPLLSAKPMVTVSDAGQPAPLTVIDASRRPDVGEALSEPVTRESDALVRE